MDPHLNQGDARSNAGAWKLVNCLDQQYDSAEIASIRSIQFKLVDDVQNCVIDPLLYEIQAETQLPSAKPG